MNLSKKINNLRAISFLLFFTSCVALVGSLSAHNYLVSFKFTPGNNYIDFNLQDIPGSKVYSECDPTINTCNSDYFNNLINIKTNKRLDNCFKHKVEIFFVVNEKKMKVEDLYVSEESYHQNGILKNQFKNQKIFLIYEVSQNKIISCIKNFKSNSMYNIFPFWYEQIYKLKKKGLKLASAEAVNPLIYGELSISNLVKRYPLNYIFKSFLYLGSILMIIYWMNYNFLFKKILNKGNNYFFYVGVFSAIFLFFHVLFLGSEIDNKIFIKLRRLIIILFILCELAAQVLLTRQLFKNSSNLRDYCYLKIIKIKVFYIIFVSLISLSVLSLLVFYNFESRVDYILEWNYFLGLLIFYFLSSIMWKKNNNIKN